MLKSTPKQGAVAWYILSFKLVFIQIAINIIVWLTFSFSAHTHKHTHMLQLNVVLMHVCILVWGLFPIFWPFISIFYQVSTVSAWRTKYNHTKKRFKSHILAMAIHLTDWNFGSINTNLYPCCETFCLDKLKREKRFRNVFATFPIKKSINILKLNIFFT